ncbi:MAG: hypothetical protein ACKV0T_11505 [Planctomycetales bacterium]
MTPVSHDDGTQVPAARTRPGGLTAVCILALLLGIVGLLTGCAGLASQAFGAQLQEAMSGMQPGGNEAMRQAQQEMNTKILAVAKKYAWMTVPLLVVKMVAELLMIAGAAGALGLKPFGRKWLMWGLTAALVIESISLIPALLLQNETQAVTQEYMNKIMSGAGGGQGAAEFGSSITQVATIIGLVLAIGWLLVKALYYVLSLRYLRKREIAALFGSGSHSHEVAT